MCGLSCDKLNNRYELLPAWPPSGALDLYAVERGPITLPYWRAGATLTFGMRLDRAHRIVFDLHYEHIEAELDAESWCENHPFRGYIRNGQSTYSSATFRFERDTRDDFFLPTRGMLLVVSIELSTKIPPLFSDYEFSKYMIKYEHSFPAFLDHAFRFSVAGGLIQDVGEAGSPFFSRFFVGDYAFFLIDKAELPRNLGLNFSEVFDYGDVMASISAEYDIPLWSTGKFFYRGYVYAAVNFSYVTKAEFLKSEDEEWSGRTKRPVSMDLGFKFDTPVGLFTFSIGYVFDLFL
jgi:outer membrane protein assembly factor BamA